MSMTATPCNSSSELFLYLPLAYSYFIHTLRAHVSTEK